MHVYVLGGCSVQIGGALWGWECQRVCTHVETKGQLRSHREQLVQLLGDRFCPHWPRTPIMENKLASEGQRPCRFYLPRLP